VRALDAFRDMKREVNELMTRALVHVPIANADTALIAQELANRASDDIYSSIDNYAKQRLAKACEDLQQGIEKTSKTFGLLTKTMNPTEAEMKKVGHDSYKAFLLHYDSWYPTLPALLRAERNIFSSRIFNNPVMRGIGETFRTYFDSQIKSLPSEDKVRKEIDELMRLDDAVMWRDSLELNPSNKWISSAVADVRSRTLIGKKTRSAIGFGSAGVSHLGIFEQETHEKVNLADSLGTAGQKLFSLSLLTCWHLEPARYPSMGRYWDLEDYKSSKPYIKEMPLFMEYGKSAVKNAIDASNLSARLGTSP
jgi:hypothetical protein